MFVENLEPAKVFHQEVFGLEVVDEDDASAVVALDNLMINLLVVANASTLVAPRRWVGRTQVPVSYSLFGWRMSMPHLPGWRAMGGAAQWSGRSATHTHDSE